MPTSYQYRTIEIDNFRSFKKLTLQKLKRINIFGGFNGVGKSSLLETIFFTMDISNPVAVLKPYIWRNAVAREDDLFYLLNDRESEAKIKTTGMRGNVQTRVSKQITPGEAITARNSSVNSSSGVMRTLEAHGKYGLLIEGEWKSEKVRNFIFPDSDGYAASALSTTNPQLPQAVILRSGINTSPVESATRLTRLIRAKRLSSIIDPLKMFQEDLSGFTILQYGNDQAIYATIKDDLVPVNMLGDGFKTLFDVILAIGIARDGCVLLDEVDASFHYSIVSKAWEVISISAAAENCQIFATSHSRETILSAAQGIADAGRDKDFTYSRLSKVNGNHVITSYDTPELSASEEFNIEFR